MKTTTKPNYVELIRRTYIVCWLVYVTVMLGIGVSTMYQSASAALMWNASIQSGQERYSIFHYLDLETSIA